MDSDNFPKLVDRRNGTTIEINANPFSLGRSLSCNYVIPDKVVSRKHCILEKHDNNWILVDTSTNGTFINEQHLKSEKSGPLKDKSVISLDLNGYSYIFHAPKCNESMDDISDEQLCLFADSVLNEMQAFQNDQNGDIGVMEIDEPIASNHPLHDHASMVKSQERHSDKKPRIETSTSESENHVIMDLINTSNTDPVYAKPGPSTEITGEPPDTTAEIKKSASQLQKEQDNFEVMENELQCSICSELFIKAVTLNCAHTFCKYCIELWKKNKSECPICRTKISGMTATLVLDNVVEKVMESSPDELRQHRKQIAEEREQQQKAQPPAKETTARGRGRTRRGRAARGRSRNSQNTGRDAVPTAGPIVQAVIEVSSESEFDDSSSSNTDSGDTNEWQDEYDNDDWYEEGMPEAYYGGYGYCFSCGRPGHWSNGCPYR